MCAPSALAHHFRYTADLKGSTVSPPTGSTALGHVVVIIDEDLHKMQILTEFNGLAGAVTEAHLHGPTAEVFAGTADIITPSPRPPAFPPASLRAITFHRSSTSNPRRRLIPRSWPPTGLSVTDPMQALFDALDAGKAYFDIHTTAFPDGEIRGFVVDVPGDFNDDGVVDAADYVVWQKTEGTIEEGHPADANNSNVVDDARLFDLARKLRQHAPRPARASSRSRRRASLGQCSRADPVLQCSSPLCSQSVACVHAILTSCRSCSIRKLNRWCYAVAAASRAIAFRIFSASPG